LKAALAAKAAAVVAAEEQLRQERAAHQEAEGRLQQERAALAEAWTALEREHAALEGVQASLKKREDEVSKQVEGELPFRSFVLLTFPSGVCSLLDFLCSWYLGLRTALGHATDRSETLQAAYDSSERDLLELRAATLETCQAVEKGEAQAGSSLASRLRALGGHFSRRMRHALHLGVQKTLGVVRSHYEVNFEAVVSGYVVPEGVEDQVAMEHVDALAADAAETLTEDFMEFLFPDAPDSGAPQA
jgi:hypothetical protein